MATSVKLDELIDAIEERSDSLFAYVDRETCEVILISDESLSLCDLEPDEIEELPDWQREEAELAQRIETTDRYIELPDRFEVNEWNVMREFCEQISHDETRSSLLDAIHGKKAFRNFKNEIARRDLWEPWNKFRRAAFGETLREWCDANAITLITTNDTSRPPA